MPITALGFLAVFSVGCLVALKRPFVGLLLYFFVFYMHPPGKYWGAYLPEIRWTFIVAAITLMSALINEKKKSDWLKPRQSKFLFIFFLFIIFQYPFAISPSWHKEFIVLFFKMFMLYYLIISLTKTPKRFKVLIITNLAGIAYIGFTALQTHSSGRFEAAGLPSISDSNLLGIHTIPILLLGGFLFLSQQNKQRYWLVPLLLFAANLIVMTGSRGAMVAIFLGGATAVLCAPKMMKARLYKWATIALVCFSFVSADLIIERFESMFAEKSSEVVEKSAESRIIILEAQVEMFREHFLIGGGHRTTLLLSPFYISKEYMTQTKAGALRGSHNLTMSILNDHGIIGFTIFSAILFCCVKQLFSIKNASEASFENKYLATGLLAAVFAFLVASQFSNSKVLEVYIWLIALIVSFSQIYSHARSSND